MEKGKKSFGKNKEKSEKFGILWSWVFLSLFNFNLIELIYWKDLDRVSEKDRDPLHLLFNEIWDFLFFSLARRKFFEIKLLKRENFFGERHLNVTCTVNIFSFLMEQSIINEGIFLNFYLSRVLLKRDGMAMSFEYPL